MPSRLPRSVRFPTSSDLAFAGTVVSSALAPSPLVRAEFSGGPAWLKLDSLQPTGSFKVRGAITAMSALEPGRRALAVSAGNHALGIAWAAQRTGIPATIVIAETASLAKRRMLESLPLELIRHGRDYDEAEAFALEMARNQGADTVFVSAYNDPLVIAGQSTILGEIVAQVPESGPLVVVVPAGGGGMLAGIALRAEELRATGRHISVIGVETSSSTAVSAAMRAGHIVPVTVEDTLADGLAGNLERGSVTVAVAIGRVDRMLQVSEAEIAAAMRELATGHGIVAEGAGAVTTAALMTGQIESSAGQVVAIVSGRNVTSGILRDCLGP